MASSSLTKLVFFACCLLQFTFSDNLVAGQSDKMQLNIYYSSLSSECQDFIINDLVEFYEYPDFYHITNITFVPFGNAILYDNQTITCQNGEEECELNKVAACIIKTFPDSLSQYLLIRCVENVTTDWEPDCFYGSQAGKAVSDCYNSDLSTKLFLEYANQTLSLNPKLDFLPLITVNGELLYTRDIGDVVAQVCTAYKGTAPLPAQCNNITALA